MKALGVLHEAFRPSLPVVRICAKGNTLDQQKIKTWPNQFTTSTTFTCATTAALLSTCKCARSMRGFTSRYGCWKPICGIATVTIRLKRDLPLGGSGKRREISQFHRPY